MRKILLTFALGLMVALGAQAATIDLSTAADKTQVKANNGDIITGTTAGAGLVIAADATVTLDNVSINDAHTWTNYIAVKCEGNATIILKGTNVIKSYDAIHAAIYVPEGYTLTIQEDPDNLGSSLEARGTTRISDSKWGGPGLGGVSSAGSSVDAKGGNIVIKSGIIEAYGAGQAAGIGAGAKYAEGLSASFGTITIEGGNVRAHATKNAAAIGGGNESTVGKITITGGKVRALGEAPNSTGIGSGAGGKSGSISISATPNVPIDILANSISSKPGPIGQRYDAEGGALWLDGIFQDYDITETVWVYDGTYDIKRLPCKWNLSLVTGEATCMGYNTDDYNETELAEYSNLTLPEEIKESAAFGGTEKTFTVARIGKNAFKNSTILTKMTLPATIREIEETSFDGCSPLLPVVTFRDGINFDVDVINRKATVIAKDKSALYTGTVVIPENIITDFTVTAIEENAFKGNRMTSITLPATLKHIGESAFWGSEYLTSLFIPKSVTSMDDNIIFDCKKMETVTVEEGNVNFYSTDGVLFLKQPTVMLLAYPLGKKATEYTVPDGVKGIAPYAFENCTNLQKVNFPDGLTSIGKEAFTGCSNLISVAIPEGVSVISQAAFDDCSALQSIVLPSTTTQLQNQAFSGSANVEYVVCKATTPPALAMNSFSTALAGKPLFVPTTAITAYQGQDVWKDFEILSIDVYEKKMELLEVYRQLNALEQEGVGVITDEEFITLEYAIMNAGQAYTNYKTVSELETAILSANSALTSQTSYLLKTAKEHAEALKADLVLLQGAANEIKAADLATTIGQHAGAITLAIKDPTTLPKVRDAYVKGQENFGKDRDALVIAARAAFKAQLDALLTDEEKTKKEYTDIIDGYKAQVDNLKWDNDQTTEININSLKVTAGVIYTKAQNDVKAQREKDTPLTLEEICDFTAQTDGYNQYKYTWTYAEKWTVFGGHNNNKAWTHARFGAQSKNLADANPSYVQNKNEFIFDVQLIEVSFAEGSLSKSGMSVEEWGVKVYKDKDCKEADLLYTVKGKNDAIQKDKATVAQLVPEGSNLWLAGYGFQVYWKVANTTTTNGVVYVEKIKFSNQGPATALDQISQEPKANSQKLIKDGQIFILHGDKIYTITGQEIR